VAEPSGGAAGRASAAQLAAAFATVYVIWGSTYLAIRFAIETLPPLLMAGARFLIAGAILYAFVRLRGAAAPPRRQWRAAAVVGGLLLLCGNGGVVLAERTVPSGVVALLVALVPAWMVAIEWVRPGGVRPAGRTLLGLVVGFAGMVLLVGPAELAGEGRIDLVGAALVLFGSAAWATGSIYAREADLPRNALLITAMQMLAGGALLVLAGLVRGEAAGVDVAGSIRRRLMVERLRRARARGRDWADPRGDRHFAAAFGAYARPRTGPGRTVVIGRDSRVSGPMFSRAATAALQSVGCDVVDVGIAPTPTVQLAVEDLGAAGGLAVTASHNPIEWNALKFIGPSGCSSTPTQGAEMRALLEGEIPRAGWDALGGYARTTAPSTATWSASSPSPSWTWSASAPPLPRGARLRPRRRGRHLPAAAGGARLPGGGHQPGDGRPLPARAGAGRGEPRRAGGARPPHRRGRRLRHRPGRGPALARLRAREGDRRGLHARPRRALVLRHRPGAVVTNLSTSRLLDDVAEPRACRWCARPWARSTSRAGCRRRAPPSAARATAA
jgi:drug/metabolite transporter (DMT)-like permease